MKRLLFLLVFSLLGYIIYAQHLPVVAVEPFDFMGGITQDEALVATELFRNELASTDRIIVVDRDHFDRIFAQMQFQRSDWANSNRVAQFGRALNAGFIIRGQLMKMGGAIYITNSMIDVNTTQSVATARAQIGNMGEFFRILTSYSAQLINQIPPPNFFIGRWQSVQTNPNRTLILEFRANGSIIVEQFQYSHQAITSMVHTPVVMTRRHLRGSYSINNNRIRIILGDFINVDTIFTFDSSRNGFV